MGIRIKHWQHFEPNWRPERNDPYANNIPFLLLPTDDDSEGYMELSDGPNGDRYLGCWVSILQFWARQKRNARVDGKLWSGNKPATVEKICRARKLDKSVAEPMQSAVSKLLEIHWLETWSLDDGQLPDACQTNGSQMSGGRESKRREEKRREGVSDDIHPPKEETPKIPFGPDGNVLLTQKEYDKLLVELGGHAELDFWLSKQNGQIANSRRKYKSHYHCWESWGKGWWYKDGKREFESTLSESDRLLRQIELPTEEEVDRKLGIK